MLLYEYTQRIITLHQVLVSSLLLEHIRDRHAKEFSEIALLDFPSFLENEGWSDGDVAKSAIVLNQFQHSRIQKSLGKTVVHLVVKPEAHLLCELSSIGLSISMLCITHSCQSLLFVDDKGCLLIDCFVEPFALSLMKVIINTLLVDEVSAKSFSLVFVAEVFLDFKIFSVNKGKSLIFQIKVNNSLINFLITEKLARTKSHLNQLIIVELCKLRCTVEGGHKEHAVVHVFSRVHQLLLIKSGPILAQNAFVKLLIGGLSIQAPRFTASDFLPQMERMSKDLAFMVFSIYPIHLEGWSHALKDEYD